MMDAYQQPFSISVYVNEADRTASGVLFDVLLNLGLKFSYTVGDSYSLDDVDDEDEKETGVFDVPLPDNVTYNPFVMELEELLNKHSAEQESGTPDYILARYLLMSLGAFNEAVRSRADWLNQDIGGHATITSVDETP